MASPEEELIEQLNNHKILALDCADGKLDFWQFVKLYDNFYHSYALDGHEANGVNHKLLQKHSREIEFHKAIYDQVLSIVCSDSDANNLAYIKAGRISSTEAQKIVKQLCESST
ncbi:hypothetical protein HII17_13395 [Thalassotalea sp. M1531]|uniref:Uncharacterized protein n=1 Tax=Thalassotalea algicola TaxID=2716224 RepID=A0A7Y0Q8V5_9GAMM|nr:hypothetical protein [Thalassotalea algicola]NMP32555.1 hypothetical protein [Thalassotalea algicola]